MKLVISALLLTVMFPATAATAKAPTCSNYHKRCYRDCTGHQLETQCRSLLCDRAKRKCLRTGIWHTKGYVYRKGMRRK